MGLKSPARDTATDVCLLVITHSFNHRIVTDWTSLLRSPKH
jgi:hypothetical protein